MIKNEIQKWGALLEASRKLIGTRPESPLYKPRFQDLARATRALYPRIYPQACVTELCVPGRKLDEYRKNLTYTGPKK